MSAIDPPSLWPTSTGSGASSWSSTCGRTSSASSWKKPGVRGFGGGAEWPLPKREKAMTRLVVACRSASGNPRQRPTEPRPSCSRTRAGSSGSPGRSTASSLRPAMVSATRRLCAGRRDGRSRRVRRGPKRLGVAQLVALDLAGRGAQEIVDEGHEMRILVAPQALLAPAAQLVGERLPIRGRLRADDERLDAADVLDLDAD